MRPLRLSIAGLMALVLVSAFVAAAFKSGSEAWAGAMFLLVAAILMLGVVGAACRSGAERAWWLGFVLFGWGYLVVEVLLRSPMGYASFLPALSQPGLLDRIAEFFTDMVKRPAESIAGGGMGGGMSPPSSLPQICHILFSLVAATVGGGLGFFLFGAPTSSPAIEVAEQAGDTSRGSIRWRTTLLCVAGLAGVSGLMLYGFRYRLQLGSGLMLTLTWGVMGLLVLGAVCGRGFHRVRMLGASLFGIGYMTLIFWADPVAPNSAYFAASHVIHTTRGSFPDSARESPDGSRSLDRYNARILELLERPVPMRFPHGAPLEDVVRSIKAETRDAEGRELPIHVDPVGLQEAEKTMQAPVVIDVDGVPLRTSLALTLRQLGLTFGVRGGVLVITNEDAQYLPPQPVFEDPFLTIGHCVFALMAAGVGSVLAPLVAGRQA